jgi:hypothetical protein
MLSNWSSTKFIKSLEPRELENCSLVGLASRYEAEASERLVGIACKAWYSVRGRARHCSNSTGTGDHW